MESTYSEGHSNHQYIDIETTKNNTSNSLTKAWSTLKFMYAKRLLLLASNNDYTIRQKAIKKLSNIKNLDDWHCSLLANIMDAKTAIALARHKNVDSRFFGNPPHRYKDFNKQKLATEVQDLLVGLHHRSNHVCIGYFITKVFDEQHIGTIIDHESSMELRKFVQSTSDILLMCLESLLHHSSIEEYAHHIVELNGLPLLMEIHHRFKNNDNVSAVLSRIISYLSVNPDSREVLYKTGWIGLLSKWVKHEDIRISIPAGRALANLDADENSVYSTRLYLLHPLMKNSKNSDVDVIFIHGLLGGVFYTWRQRSVKQAALSLFETDVASPPPPQSSSELIKPEPAKKKYVEEIREALENDGLNDYEVVWNDLPTKSKNAAATCPLSCSGDSVCKKSDCYTFCWPKDWLADDIKRIRVIGVSYDTSLSMWASMCPMELMKTTLEERSNELSDKMIKAGVGDRPIIWVTHSMGGLIVKNMLVKAFNSEKSELKNICQNTKAIVFYSTPHIGSRLANLGQATALLLWPSVEVQELREKSPKLVKLHKEFLKMVTEVPMKVITFLETKSTAVTAMKFNFLFVEPHSGNPGVGEYYEIPQDHLDICKPTNRSSFLYQRVLHLVHEVLAQEEPEKCLKCEEDENVSNVDPRDHYSVPK